MAILVQSNRKPSVSFPSQTGSIVTFNSQYAGLPLKSHKVAVTATQSGSGTPSPDNVRPISGHDSIIISHSGEDTSNPTVYTINLGGTYYGGEHDARTGLLTITHEMVDLATLRWVYQENRNRFYTTGIRNTVLPPSDNSTPISGICSHLQIVDYNSNELIDNNLCVPPSGYIYLRATAYTTVEDLLIALSGAQFVYPLATPTTIQLPPCPIDTLQGMNNIWANTGDTTVSFIKIGG